MNYVFQWDTVFHMLPNLLRGLEYTIGLSITSLIGALVIGLVVSQVRLSTNRFVSGIGFVYIQFFRSISAYIYVVWVYFALAAILGVSISPFVAALISLILLHSAYIAEIFRGAFAGIDKGQRDAAHSISLKRTSTFFEIMLPQAFRIAMPQLNTQFAGIIKDTAVVAVIGATDLMYETITAASTTFRAFEFYTTAAIIYIILISLSSYGARKIEVRLSRYVNEG